MCVSKRIWEHCGSTHLGWGVVQAVETRPFLRRVTVPNLVSLGQRCRHTWGSQKLGVLEPATLGQMMWLTH